MPTVTLQGFYADFTNDTASHIGQAELQVVLPSRSTTFSHRVVERGEGLPEVEIDGAILDGAVRTPDRGGQSLHDLTSNDLSFTAIGRISWSGGTTTLLQITVESNAPGTPARDYYFRLDGAELPNFSSPAALDNFGNNSIRGIGTATGSFAPGANIVWDSLPNSRFTHDDEFYGTPGNDTQRGGAGHDYFNATPGADRYVGGNGWDQVSYAHSDGAVVANLTTGRARDGFGSVDRLYGIEALRGSAQNDRLIGDDIGNMFRGLAGNDTIDGRGGVDVVRYDRDQNYGGADGVVVNLRNGAAIDGFGNRDQLISIENVLGSERADKITGNGAANTLEGLGGRDLLRGMSGRDHLMGGRGNDRIDGGNGNDRLQGDQGSDRFIFRGDFGRDRIVDFGIGNDRIDLRQIDSITSFRDLTRNHLTESGDNLIINAGGGNTILLLGVARSEIEADDFLF